MKSLSLFTLVGLFVLTSCTVKDKALMNTTVPSGPPEDAFDYVKSSGGIDEYRLKSNDLSVLLMEDHSAPVVTFMVTYHVGSRNEAVGYTGSTHLLEHMMFKGSKNFNKENGKPIWTVLQDVGAQINATTWSDRTNYFELLPSEHLERAVAIEADRMRNAFIKDEDRQPEMTVVRNEFERGENSPYQALDKLIWATAYQAHPYHHSTIGWRSDIENVPTERLKKFYDTFYWPNNATVTVIGDFQKDEAFRLIRDYFGVIPRSPHDIPVMYTTEPKQEGPRRVVIKRTGEAGILGIAHKTPEGLHPDMYALQVLSRILNGGKSSRFYQAIVDKGLATNVFIDDHPFHDNGLFVTYVFLTPGTDAETVEKIVLDEYRKIQEEGVTEEEVAKAIAQIRADEAFSRDGSFSIASHLNEAIAAGDWTYYTTFLDKIKAVTPADVQRVAQTYLVEDQSTTGIFIPESNSGGDDMTAGPSQITSAHQPYHWRPEGLAAGAAAGGGATLASQITESEPLAGLRLFTMNSGVQDVVTIKGSLLGGDQYSPEDNPMVADLTASMLDQGTKSKSKYDISEQLESVGAEINFSSGTYRVRFSARCLKEDVPLVLSLLAEQLREPAFNADDLESVKKRTIGSLRRAKESTRNQASTAFSQIIYPEGHPNYKLSTDDAIAAVERITTDDLRAFHDRVYGLGSVLISAVGDVDDASFSQEVQRAFAGWKTSSVTFEPDPHRARPNQPRKSFLTIRDKTSVDLYIGQAVGLSRDDPDYYPLMFGVYVLGGNFSARLMSTVRDQQGLTYGTYSALTGVDNKADGYWFAWGTFAPSLLDKGIQAIQEQLKLWKDQGITPEELEAKKNTITGSYKVGLATTNGLASQILTNAERGHDLSFLDEYPNIINRLTLEEVNHAIQTYVDLDNLILVAAGSIDSEGHPLEGE
ncbi:MAG: insulinase family protein [Candidatus Neomarinimicrobiota bacterium]|nr:MAG: insulinase family protein [Candidatus Neomarinimicrobiota bacterium]